MFKYDHYNIYGYGNNEDYFDETDIGDCNRDGYGVGDENVDDNGDII